MLKIYLKALRANRQPCKIVEKYGPLGCFRSLPMKKYNIFEIIGYLEFLGH